MCDSSFYKVKKDAPQDAQLARWNLIATQYRSRAKIAHLRNLFNIIGCVDKNLTFSYNYCDKKCFVGNFD